MVSYRDPEKQDTSRRTHARISEVRRRQERQRQRREERQKMDFDTAFPLAKEDALTMLDYMNRSRSDIITRLRERGYHDDVCEAVADRLVEVNIIDDSVLARAIVRDRFELKGVVGQPLYQELYRKGIPDDIAREAMAELDEHTIEQRLGELVEKKRRTMPQGLSPEKRRHRMIAFLMRKGYSYDQINRSYHPSDDRDSSD